MSLVRMVLVAAQAYCNKLACTPPNPTPPKARYLADESEHYILQLAPLIFKFHQIVISACAAFEILYYFATVAPPHPVAIFIVCPASDPDIHLSPIFIIGVLAVILGTYIRLDCFRTLGPLFTFDLTIFPQHKLVTSRFYAYVRHPAYTGSLLLVAGLALSHLTQGSWMTECGPLHAPGSATLVWAVWWIWTISVGISRAATEDRQMKKLFKAEWDTYASNVPWWFLPGLY